MDVPPQRRVLPPLHHGQLRRHCRHRRAHRREEIYTPARPRRTHRGHCSRERPAGKEAGIEDYTGIGFRGGESGVLQGISRIGGTRHAEVLTSANRLYLTAPRRMRGSMLSVGSRGRGWRWRITMGGKGLC
jgi:hypothetical protein